MTTEPVARPTLAQALGRLRVALQDTYAQVSQELELSAQQAELLCAAMRPTAVGELARTLRCDRSNVSRLVDRAAQRGLLARRHDLEDGRVSLVELSPEGERLAREFIARLESRSQPLLAEWSRRRGDDAVQMLTAIAETLEASPALQAMSTRRLRTPTI